MLTFAFVQQITFASIAFITAIAATYYSSLMMAGVMACLNIAIFGGFGLLVLLRNRTGEIVPWYLVLVYDSLALAFSVVAGTVSVTPG